jgi:hypothetical protein
MSTYLRLKLIAGVLGLATAGLLAGCGAAASASSSSTPVAASTTAPSATDPDQIFLDNLHARPSWPQINNLYLDTSDLVSLGREGISDLSANEDGTVTIADLQEMSVKEQAVVAPNPGSVTPLTWQQTIDVLDAAESPPADAGCSYYATSCPQGPFMPATNDPLAYAATVLCWHYGYGNFTLADSSLPQDELTPDAYAVTGG